MDRWAFVVAVPKVMENDPELWERLNEGDIEPDYGEMAMKLSEAIREGAKLKPVQCYDLYFGNDGISSCALGAAMEVLLQVHNRDQYWSICEENGDYDVNCLIAEETGTPIKMMRTITYRNDHGETREQIADWLETEGY